MTITRTRELLGKKVEGLTDSELLVFINSTDKMLDQLMKRAIKDNVLLNKKERATI